MRVYKILCNVIFAVSVTIIAGLGVVVLISDIHPHIIVSGSMETEIHTGSICFINYKDRNVHKGDIIAYHAGEMTVLHRVIEEDYRGKYITKGDNNDAPDLAPVSQKQIMGKYVFGIPKLGYAVMQLKSPAGIILAAMFFILFILVGRLIRYKNNCRKM